MVLLTTRSDGAAVAPDLVRLAAELGALAPAARAAVLAMVPTAKDQRDDAVRALFGMFIPRMRPTPAAEHIARLLVRYLAAAWHTDKRHAVLASADPVRDALHRVAMAGDGRLLSARQLLNIRDGWRG